MAYEDWHDLVNLSSISCFRAQPPLLPLSRPNEPSPAPLHRLLPLLRTLAQSQSVLHFLLLPTLKSFRSSPGGPCRLPASRFSETRTSKVGLLCPDVPFCHLFMIGADHWVSANLPQGMPRKEYRSFLHTESLNILKDCPQFEWEKGDRVQGSLCSPSDSIPFPTQLFF
jgi:hypothetical protein